MKLFFTLTEAKLVRDSLYTTSSELERALKNEAKPLVALVREVIEEGIANKQKMICYLSAEIERESE
jgi:hypothetical protein